MRWRRCGLGSALLVAVLVLGCGGRDTEETASSPGGAMPAGAEAGGGEPREAKAGPVPSGESALQLGLHLFRKGDFKGAEGLLSSALKAAPGDHRILEALGSIYLRTDRYRQAEDTMRQALAADPSSIAAHLGLAAVFIETGRYDAALPELAEVRRRDPGNLAAIVKGALLDERRGLLESAAAGARAAIARQPASAEAHYVLGLSLLGRGDLPGAAAEMRRVTELAPDHLGALSHLATIDMRLGRRAEADRDRQAHEQALYRKRVEDRVRVHRVKGVEAFNREDYPAALQEFQQVAVEDPKDPQVHLYLGSVFLALGDLDKAQQALQKSLALDPHSERAYMELGRLHAMAGRTEEAVAALRRAIAANPTFAEPHYFLAGVYRARGEADLYQKEMARYRDLRQRSRASAMEVVEGPEDAPR